MMGRLFVFAVLGLAATGCARKAVVSSPEPVAGTRASTSVEGSLTRWTGTFKQSQSAASAIVGPTTPGKGAAYGTMTAQTMNGMTGTTFELSISAPVAAGTQLAWAVFTGSCGAPTPPLAGPHEFPTIEISSSGGARVKASLSFTLDPRSSYHTKVYWAARVSDVSNVMMCAPLMVAGR